MHVLQQTNNFEGKNPKRFHFARNFSSSNVLKGVRQRVGVRQQIIATRSLESLAGPLGEDTDICVTVQANDRKFQTTFFLFTHIRIHGNKQINHNNLCKVSFKRMHIYITDNIQFVELGMHLPKIVKINEKPIFVLNIRFSDHPQSRTRELPCSATNK
jgi:hypothetical protein